MMQALENQKEQDRIAKELDVHAKFVVSEEMARRIKFISAYLMEAKARSLVLGISGGIDSTTTGRLAQLAVEGVREKGYAATFIAMRLPYGVQKDESDAQLAMQFIRPDRVMTLDIRPPADAMLTEMMGAGLVFQNAGQQDFVLGNVKARQRMIAQYAVAGAEAGLVLGTDHAAEAVMGFFTKFGDGACDLAPLAGLTKRRVRAIATLLGAPQRLVDKVPTADLEDLAPQRPDEDAYGISYEEIDNFLEGMPVSDTVRESISRHYNATKHKRAMPAVPASEREH